jgi:predicted nucleotidyltransferase
MNVSQTQLDLIVQRAREFGAKRLFLFGSALETPDDVHDIDLAADIPGLDLFLFAGRLEHELRCTIDIVALDEPSPLVDSILRRGKQLI